MNLKALLYGLAEGRHTIRAISRAIRTSIALVFLGLKTGMSYATLDRFWTQFASLAEAAFKALTQVVANLGILGTVQAAYSTSIATPLLNDPNGRWSYDATKEEYYFGHELLLVVNVDT